MGCRCRFRGGHVLSAALGRGGRDAALLHHDRDRADRRDGRPRHRHLPHADRGGARRDAVHARGRRASELPDVVCRHARVGGDLSEGAPVAHRRRRHGARGAHRAVGARMDRRLADRVAPRRHRDLALRGLPLSPARPLRRDHQPADDARDLGVGDAHGHHRGGGHAVRARRLVLAGDGSGPRLDDLHRAVGDEPAGGVRAHGGVRHGSVADLHARPRAALSLADAAAPERRAPGRRGGRDDGPLASARCADRAGWQRRCPPRRRRPARGGQIRQRRVRDQGMARGRRRRARSQAQYARPGHPVR